MSWSLPPNFAVTRWMPLANAGSVTVVRPSSAAVRVIVAMTIRPSRMVTSPVGTTPWPSTRTEYGTVLEWLTKRRAGMPTVCESRFLTWLAAEVAATANALLLLGPRLGDLTVQSVLTALYPAGTIILAAVV